MRVTKSITLTVELAELIQKEAKRNNRPFSNMVEHILRSHYTEKDRPTSDHNES